MGLEIPSRRGLLLGLGAALAAPAVVQAASLMKIRGLVLPRFVPAIAELLDPNGIVLRVTDIMFEQLPGANEWRASADWDTTGRTMTIGGWRVRNFHGRTFEGEPWNGVVYAVPGCHVNLQFDCWTGQRGE